MSPPFEKFIRKYKKGDVICEENDTDNEMYIVYSGSVDIYKNVEDKCLFVTKVEEGDFFGEMALFEKDVRSATVRPLGDVRVLTVDRKMFLRKIHDDPSLAFMIMQRMSKRLRELNAELTRLTSERMELVD